MLTNIKDASRDKRLNRISELMQATGKTRQDFLKLGFTESQISSWFAAAGSTRARSPSAAQLTKIWHGFDWSPTYVVFGRGAKLLSQVNFQEDIFERMDKFQAVLQLALDEAEANKQRYRGALKTIEDRNQQIALNLKTLKSARLLMQQTNQKLDLLSNQLSKKLSKGEDTPIPKQLVI